MTTALSCTRAHLCEILAIRCLREYGDNLLDLAAVAVTSWPVYSGADPVTLNIAREENEDMDDRVGNAIEMAIISKAKRFIKSSACQKVINAIWRYNSALPKPRLLMNSLSLAENAFIKPIVATRSFPMYVIHYHDISRVCTSIFS